MTDTKLDEVCRQLELTLTAALLGYRNEADKPHDKRWPHFEWRVTVLRSGVSYSTDYRTGVAYARPLPEHMHSSRREEWLASPRAAIAPTVASVVACLMSDAQSGSESFEEFCSNAGLDTDSRKAFETYLACQGAGTGMRRLLGEHYDAVAEAASEY